MKPAIDITAVFCRVPDILGLELTMKNGKWEGPYYINRDRHPKKRDKLRVWVYKGSVIVGEQGGESMTIQKWLLTYGGCHSWREVYRMLDSQTPTRFASVLLRQKETAGKYITEDVLSDYRQNNKALCPLFAWMCNMFGKEIVENAWERYNCTTDKHRNTVFWYTDSDGNICHDKIMAYNIDGHRNKTRGAYRRYTTEQGYTYRCLFGEHLLADWHGEVYVVESEKTALLCSCVWPDALFLACGGKNLLSRLKDGWVLLPDIDGQEEWSKRGIVSEWWHGWKSCTPKSDIGDLICAFARVNRLETLSKGKDILLKKYLQ